MRVIECYLARKLVCTQARAGASQGRSVQDLPAAVARQAAAHDGGEGDAFGGADPRRGHRGYQGMLRRDGGSITMRF